MRMREFLAATLIGLVIAFFYYSTDVVFAMANEYYKSKNQKVRIDFEIKCRVCETINYVYMEEVK